MVYRRFRTTDTRSSVLHVCDRLWELGVGKSQVNVVSLADLGGVGRKASFQRNLLVV